MMTGLLLGGVVAELLGVGAAVVLGQGGTRLAGAVGHRAPADLATGNRQLRDGYGISRRIGAAHPGPLCQRVRLSGGAGHGPSRGPRRAR